MRLNPNTLVQPSQKIVTPGVLEHDADPVTIEIGADTDGSTAGVQLWLDDPAAEVTYPDDGDDVWTNLCALMTIAQAEQVRDMLTAAIDEAKAVQALLDDELLRTTTQSP